MSGSPDQERTETGKFVAIPEERRNAIVQAAKAEILNGNASMAQIAEKHGVARRTLQYWLAQLGDDYKVLREAWIDNLLIDAGEEIEGADDPMRLARARELWKRATWYAERRDKRYSQDAQGESGAGVTINLHIGDTQKPAIDVTPLKDNE